MSAIKTLADAIEAGEALGWSRAFAAQARAGVVRFRCEAALCRRACLAFELRDVRADPRVYGEAGFVCSTCWTRLRRLIRAAF